MFHQFPVGLKGLKIAALIFYCALDCLIKKGVHIRKSSKGLV